MSCTDLDLSHGLEREYWMVIDLAFHGILVGHGANVDVVADYFYLQCSLF